MFRSTVRVLEIITYPLELNGDARVVIEDGRFRIALARHERIRIEEIFVILVLRDIAHIGLSEETIIETEFEFLGVSD